MAIEGGVQATPTSLKGKESSAEQSVEARRLRCNLPWPLPTEEDTRPKVLICGEWRKVLDGYLRDASGQLERDQFFINDLAKQLVRSCAPLVTLTPILVQSPSPATQRLT